MCGICGIVLSDSSSRIVELETLKKMTDVLIHRGPDRDGFFLGADKKAGLGFRRLSIIDLSSGDQPIGNENGSLQIVFNGEIYNFRELRATLEKRGHLFHTNSDTETIVHAYEEYGAECVKHLHGMFAFALWDIPRRKLLLARDRLGKKPLYYWHGTRGLHFASEIKALLQVPEMPREADEQALAEYFHYEYIPAPLSILKGVFKLPPAHTLLYDAGKNKLVLSRYWQPEFEPKSSLSLPEAEEALLEELRRAVRRRLVSDVPLGALLSGGIDSSLVVALMAETVPKVKTFTIGFDDADFDERPHARAVADRYNTDHHELVVRPNMLDILPRLVWYLDEPMADSSAVPTYYVAQMARQHVTVVLNGDGGDENFGGYWHYGAALAAQRFGTLPSWFRNGILRPVFSAGNRIKQNSLSTRFLRLLDQDGWLLSEHHEIRTTVYDQTQLDSLLLKNIPKSLTSYYESIYGNAPNLKGLDAMLRADLLGLLPGKFLVKMDRMSMGNSLEARSPLLDQSIVEFAAQLPASYKSSNGKSKLVLRNLAKRFIPRNLASRRKMGFGVPLAHWLYDKHANEVRQTLLDPKARIYEYVNPAAVKGMLNCPPAEREINSVKLWGMLILETWFHEVLSK